MKKYMISKEFLQHQRSTLRHKTYNIDTLREGEGISLLEADRSNYEIDGFRHLLSYAGGQGWQGGKRARQGTIKLSPASGFPPYHPFAGCPFPPLRFVNKDPILEVVKDIFIKQLDKLCNL
jgi:hypothetical protein